MHEASTDALQALVIDDHPVVRAGLAALLASAHPESRVAGAADLAEALALLAAQPGLHLAVLDVHLGDAPPLAALRSLREQHPLLPVLMMSGDEDPLLAAQALREGAAGWVTKGSEPRALLAAVELVLQGGCAVPAFLARASRQPEAQPETLTERQLGVLAELVEGRSNKDIARRLGLAEPTVKAHLVTVFRVLRVSNRAQAALAGRAHLAGLAKLR